MKRRWMKLVSVVLYALAAAVIVCYACMEWSVEVYLSPAGQTVMLLAACGLMYVGGRILGQNVDERYRRLPMRVNGWVWFGLYLWLLATLTVFGRNVGFRLPDWNRDALEWYLRYSFNIIPGHMVADMILSALRGSVSPTMALVNIFGNIAALMPTAFFLPNLFPKQRRFRTFALTVTGMVACIEITQFVTMTGNFDIDDFILNIGGACLMFRLLQSEQGQKPVKRIYQ